MPAPSSPRRRIIVDGSNLATEGRSMPSLAQLDDAITTFLDEYPGFTTSDVTVVVDATFGHRIDPSEVPAFDQAVEHGEMITPPAGAIGRGDGFILRIAEKADALVLSNDSFQEFHAERPWLFDPGRLIGGKPVPGVGWVFTPRTPVRGAKSRAVTAQSKREARQATAADGVVDVVVTEDAAPTKRATKATKATKSAKGARTPRGKAKVEVLVEWPDDEVDVGLGSGDRLVEDPAPPKKAKKAAKAAKATTTVKAAKSTTAAKAGRAAKAADAGENGEAAGATGATKATKATKAGKAGKTTKTTKAGTATKAAKAAKAPKATKTTKAAKRSKATAPSEPEEAPDGGPGSDAPSADAGDPSDNGSRSGRSAGSPLNEPLTFLNFVAEHPVGSTFDGTVVAFTSHGAHVDVDGMLAHIPLRGLGDPPPARARAVLTKGETRPFTLVGLDAPHRRAEVVLPELAPVAVAEGR